MKKWIRQRQPGTFLLPQDALTLIELMTVILMMSLVSAVMLQAFANWLPRYRLRRAAFDLFSNFQHAQMLAIRNAGDVVLTFDVDSDAYRLVSCGKNGQYDGSAGGGDDILERVIRFVDYGSGVTFGIGKAAFNATTAPAKGFPHDAVSYAGNKATFNAEGLTRRLGYVYLTDSTGVNTYAVGTPTFAGVVKLRRWTGTGWQ